MTDAPDRIAALAAQVNLNSESLDTVISIVKGFVGRDADLAAARSECDALGASIDEAVTVLAAKRDALTAALAGIEPPTVTGPPVLTGAV